MSLYVDWGKQFSNVKAPRAHLLALLTAGLDKVNMNFEQEMVEFDGVGIPFAMLGLNSDPPETGYNMTYTVKGTY